MDLSMETMGIDLQAVGEWSVYPPPAASSKLKTGDLYGTPKIVTKTTTRRYAYTRSCSATTSMPSPD